MKKTILAATTLVLAIAGSALLIGACGGEEDAQDLTGTWKGSMGGYVMFGDSGRKSVQDPVAITIREVDGRGTFKATIALSNKGSESFTAFKVPGVVSGEEDHFWMASTNGYYVGEVDGDEMELVYLKSFAIDPTSPDGTENVAQIGTFKKVE